MLISTDIFHATSLAGNEIVVQVFISKMFHKWVIYLSNYKDKEIVMDKSK